MKKFLIILISICVLGILGQKIYTQTKVEVKNMVASAISALPVEPQKDYATITFAGDVMFDRGVKGSVNKNFAGDYAKLFDGINIFKNDDITFLNLEGPVSDSGHKVGSIYSFRMNPSVIGVLKNLGIDIVNFANNHVGDYTKDAFKDTIDRLLAGDIAWTGAGYNYDDAKTLRVITANDIKFGFIGFSDVGPEWMKATIDSPGILLANDKNFVEIIKNAKQKCDVLIVSFHWGEEYQKHNARQEFLAKSAIDSGADIIVGHHPHVPQDIGYYKDHPIIYSLGNFMFDQYFSTETMSGLVVQMEIKKDGSIQKLTKYKSQQNKLFQIESITEIN